MNWPFMVLQALAISCFTSAIVAERAWSRFALVFAGVVFLRYAFGQYFGLVAP